MATNALALRMKYRKLDAIALAEIIDSEDSSDLEVEVASEFLEKLEESEEKVEEKVEKKAEKKAAKKVVKKVEPEEEEDENDGSSAASIKRQNKRTTNIPPEEELTEEEEALLAEAEEEFEKRQKTRKTPSKSDSSMKKAAVKKEKTPRESKRENLDESEEVPGLKVGSEVLVGEESGEITRIYKSSDGKEKCMVKIEGGKAIKKRVTAVTLVEAETSKAKTPKKKK